MPPPKSENDRSAVSELRPYGNGASKRSGARITETPSHSDLKKLKGPGPSHGFARAKLRCYGSGDKRGLRGSCSFLVLIFFLGTYRFCKTTPPPGSGAPKAWNFGVRCLAHPLACGAAGQVKAFDAGHCGGCCMKASFTKQRQPLLHAVEQ